MNNMTHVVQNIVTTMDDVLAGQFGLIPPEQYDVDKREGRIYVTGSFDPIMVGKNLKLYESQDTLRVLRQALGLPVVFTQRTRFAYVALASGKLNLPRSVQFPGFGDPQQFRLGWCLRGEVAPQANRLGNVLIGANQGAGKSNTLKLFVHQARHADWKIYICDPDGHTFNPDWWNPVIASPVGSSPEDLLELCDRVYADIADRAFVFRQVANGGIPPADLDAYNVMAATQDIHPLPRIGLFIDEANSNLGNRAILKKLSDLARRGRKWGLHIVLAGHEWHKDIVPAELNDMLQTRIGLSVANQETANVVLRSGRWGKWVMGKPAGRGVIRIDQYQPMQFYLVTEEMEREWLSGATQPMSPIPEDEVAIIQRVLDESSGKMTAGMLTLWGMGHREARKLVERYETLGWLMKDPSQGNARVVTEKLTKMLPNRQTRQSLPNPPIARQTDAKPWQTPDFAGA